MKPIRPLLLTAAFLALPGCASTPPEVPPTLSFADARAVLLTNRSRIWKDPESIRDASIGPPFTCINTIVLTCVCVELNARNSLGGYTGLQKRIVELGRPEPTGREMVLGDKCEGLQPFPELNGGGPPARR